MVAAPNSWRERQSAPAPGTVVCALDEVPDGKARQFVWGEGRDSFSLIILRSGESVWGYLNKCPHFGTPLNLEPDRFLLSDHSRIYCVTHYAMFRFEDGFCEEGPCAGDALTKVPLAVAERRVCIAD